MTRTHREFLRLPAQTFFAIYMVLTVMPGTAADSDPIAAVTGGRVQGVMLDKGGARFKGLPYAQPPLGDPPWREPLPVKPWTGLRAPPALGCVFAQTPNVIYRNATEQSNDSYHFFNFSP